MLRGQVPMRVLVVDDSAELRELVSQALTRDGHQVVAVEATDAAERALAARDVDLVVLDLALPGAWGADWCRRMRHDGMDAMVLVLTAHGEVARRLEGFEAGADDFLAKPFALAELRARVRALGRRRQAGRTRVLRLGEVEVDFPARRARRDGQDAPLTAREWSVLECLASRGNRVVPRSTLLEEVWGAGDDAASASLEVIVGRIRKKLGSDVVRTVRGEGYALGG